MSFFGVGPLEILLIAVLALIVFGPEKLPEIMGQVGKAIGDFRRATSELSNEFNRTIQAELQETRAVVDETKATFTDAKASVNDAHASLSTAFTSTPAPVRTAVPGDALTAAANGTHVVAGTNGSAPAPATPALADTSQWSWETSPAAPADGGSANKIAPPSAPQPRTVPDELLPPY